MSEQTEISPKRGIVRRIFSSVPMLILLLLVWATALAWGVGAYALHQRPDLVRSRLDTLLAQRYPTVTLSMGVMSPSLWPSPGIRMHDVLLREHNGATLLAETCELQFRWGDLFSGKLVPSRLALDNATAHIVLPSTSTPPAPAASPIPGLGAPELATAVPVLAGIAALKGLTLDMNNVAVQLTLQEPDTPTLRIQGLVGSVTTPNGEAAGLLGLEPGEASLRWTDLELQSADFLLRLRDAKLAADSIRLSKDTTGLIRTGKINFSALVDAGSAKNPKNAALRDARIDLSAALALTAGPPDIRGKLELSGIWQINGTAVPVSGTLPFGSRDVRTGIDIVDAALRMDTNTATVTATFLPGETSLTGRMNVERFSLPRWFAFARELPESLVDTLDNIRGTFTFHLTPQALTVPNLKFSVKEIDFSGTGGVEDWATPIIRIEASTKAADINRVFPELVEKPSATPSFNGPPLLPGPIPLDTPDIGFFIRLRAKEANFWKCTGKGFLLELSPAWSSSGTRIDGVKLATRLEQFYGGKLDASLLAKAPHFSAKNSQLSPQAALRPEKATLRLNLNLRNAHGEKLIRAATGKAHAGGTLNAEADLSGSGGGLAEFLAGLKGSLNATLNGGFFTVNGQKTPFERLTVRGDGLAGTSRIGLPQAPLPPVLSYAARWRLELTPPSSSSTSASAQTTRAQTDKALRVSLDATGPLRFSTTFWLPVAVQNLPVRAVGTLNSTPFNLSGKITATMDDAKTALSEAKVAVADLSGRLAEADISGNMTFTTSTTHPDALGMFAASTSDLRSLLARFNFSNVKLWPQNAFRRGDVRADVDWRGKTLQLSNLRGTLDATNFSGKLRVVDGQQWSGELSLDELDTSHYTNPPDSSAAKTATPWPTTLMKELDINADIRIKRLEASDILAEDCRFPITLKNGKLAVSPISLRLGNAPQEVNLRADVLDNALSLRFSSTVRNADLRSMWKQAATTDTDSLGGLGNSTLNLYGLSRSAADIPACLNGTWAGNIQSGYFSSGTSRRGFTSLSASGNMKSGVLTSRDFLLSGKNYSVRGGGTVNLVNRTLNYRLTASLPGVPAIPIAYSGSLADPKRSINAFSTVASVLGNVGKGVFSLLDSVLSVPLNLLR